MLLPENGTVRRFSFVELKDVEEVELQEEVEGRLKRW